MLSKNRKALLLALVSLVLAGVWVDVTGYLDVFSNPAATGRAEEMTHYACYAGRIVASLAFLAAPRWFEASFGRFVALAFGCMGLGTVLYAFGFYQTLLDPAAVAASGSMLVGMGHIWVVSAAYAYVLGVGSVRARDVLGVLVGAQVVERLLVEALDVVLDGPSLVVGLFALPVAAVAALACAERLLAHARRRMPDEDARCAPGTPEHRYYLALLVMAGVCLVACGAMSTAGIWGNAGVGQYAGELGSLALAAVECLLVAGLSRASFSPAASKPLALRYQGALLVLITGFALVSSRPMLALVPEGLVGVLLVTVENYAHVLFWVIALDAAAHLGWPVYRTFGVGLLACSAAGLAWSVFLEHGMAAAESAVLVVFYLMVLVCVVYPQAFDRAHRRTSADADVINTFALAGEPRLTPGVNGRALQRALEERCACLAREHGLSAREGEVLVLALKGVTRQGMCAQLHLSEGTVKTHLTHIYAKLGIHSQAQLIALAYEGADPGEGV